VQTVGPMIAAVAPLGQGIGRGLAFEVGARHVVQEPVVVQGEEFPQPRDQVLLQCRLVGEHPIQGPVEPIVIDQGGGQREQVLERRPAIPIFGDVQLAGAGRARGSSRATRPRRSGRVRGGPD